MNIYNYDTFEITNLIIFVHNALGAVEFLQLLNEPNNQGLSPAMEARNSRGPAYEALRSIISKHTSIFKPGIFDAASGPVVLVTGALMLATTVVLLESDEINLLIGGGVFALGGVLCRKAFKKRNAFQEASKTLSLFVD